MNLHRLSIYFLISIMLFASSPICFARSKEDQPSIKQFRWTQTPAGFTVTALLHKGFNREIEESINSGIPATFHFFLYCKRMRWYWDNQTMAREEYTHTVTYDTLRKHYTITCQRKGDPKPFLVETTDDSFKMRTVMATFKGALNVSSTSILPGKQYYLSLEATMRTENLPGRWNEILFFISNDFETKTSRQFLPVLD